MIEKQKLVVKDEDNKLIRTSIDIDSLKTIRNYGSIYFKIKINGLMCLYSGVIDNKYNTVIPFRCEFIDEEKESINVYDSENYIALFDDNAIYGVNDTEFYLININSTKYKKDEFGRLIPENYLRKIDAYETVSNSTVNILIDNQFYMLDATNNTLLTFGFDYLSKIKNSNVTIGSILLDHPLYGNICLYLLVDHKGKISRKISINKEYYAITSPDIIKDKQAIIDYCVGTMPLMFEDDSKGKDKLCKTIQ